MENKNIIIVGLQDWDTPIGSNCKNIALELAKNNTVLYVNYPLDTITYFREGKSPQIKNRVDVIKSGVNRIEKQTDNLFTLHTPVLINSINWIPFGFLFDTINKANNRKFASAIKAAAKQMGFTDFILFNDNDIFRSFYLKEMLQPKAYIYYIRDFLLAVPYWKKHGERLEPELIKKSDLVVTNSEYLNTYAAAYNKNSRFIGQGCETGLFSASIKHDKPEQLKNISGPVIGYIGALNSHRIDISLLVYLADSMPGHKFVLVGPQDENFKNSDLHNKGNVTFVPAQPVDALPSFLAYFDVAINPQILNPVTIGNYPRKIDEYLAMGKPVVALKTEAMKMFEHVTYLAESYPGYKAAILKALDENSPQKTAERIACAEEHTWENSVAALKTALANTAKKELEYA